MGMTFRSGTARKSAENEPFAQADHQHQQEDGAEVVQEELGIEQHAHRGEKEQAEKIAQWDDVAERLVAVIRFVEDHAGDEGAEGKGQPTR
jgi:hypothetical protein